MVMIPLITSIANNGKEDTQAGALCAALAAQYADPLSGYRISPLWLSDQDHNR